MAINYLNNINLNKNQLEQAVVENQPNDASAGASPIKGQIYYNTTNNQLRQYDGSNWQSIAGDITSLTQGTNINITNENGPSPTINLNDSITLAGRLYLQAVDTSTTLTNALFRSGTGEIEKRALGTGAFGPTPVGAYLPLAGGTMDTGATITGDGSLFIKADTQILFRGTTPGGSVSNIASIKTVNNDYDMIELFDNNRMRWRDGMDVYLDDSAATNYMMFTSSGGNHALHQFGGYEFQGLGTSSNTIMKLVGTLNAGYVELYHSNSKKFETTSTGVTITGAASATTFLGDLNGTINTATTGVTQTAGDNTTKIATTAFVKAAVDAGAFTFGVGADTGTNLEVASGDVVDIAGSPNISTAISTVNSKPTVTVSLADDVTIGGDFDAGGDGSFAGDVSIEGDLNMNSRKIYDLLDPSAAQDAATKNYVDSSIVGNLVYQGGYNAATNTPDLDSSPSSSIKKGWTYTVTADGTFFTEQVRVGDVLIAEENAPTALADWTTVQNNIDLADANTVGLGNVVPGSSGTITAPYSNGTAALDVVNSTAAQKGAVIVAAGTGISVGYSSGTATVTNTETNASNTDEGTIDAGDLSGTVTHSWGTEKVIVQTYKDNSTDNYPTVFCDITRTSNAVTATIASTETDDIIILVQKVG